MLTNELIESFTDMAGDNFMWDVSGGNRPPSSYVGVKGFRAILRNWIAERQGYVCPQCGNALSGAVEFCHIVSRGPKVKGFHAGNVFVGHASCNATTKPIHDDNGNVISGVAILTLDYFKRPDAVVTDWAPFAEIARSAV